MAAKATLLDSVIGFAGALRRSGLPISIGECLDASAALSHIDLLDRQMVRTSLCATLVKREEHLAAFGELFAAWFAARQHDAESLVGPRGPYDPLADLPDALRRGDLVRLRAAAAAAVAQFGGLDLDRVSSARHHLYRVLLRLDLTQMLQRAMAGLESDPDAAGIVALLRLNSEEFRRMLTREILALRSELTGDDAGALDDVDFLQASPAQLQAMQQTVRPLARRLATRLARRRQSGDVGRIDVRRTVRRSLSSGGVPIDPAFRRPRVHHPDLFVLCDLSGSVAEFARFTIALLHALYRELPRTRLFVFVDGVDEVTGLIETLPGTVDVRHLLKQSKAVGSYGHSDYGAAFGRFWTRYGGDVAGTATVIIAGDGRTNYRDAGLATLRRIHDRARRVYWLNPEPRTGWNTADSNIDEYRRHCDGVYEVRNLRQLADAIYQLS